MTPPAALMAAAVDYASRGVPIFPLILGKLPVIKSAHPDPDDPLHGKCRGGCGREGHGVYDATTDVDKVRERWTRWPDANIGHGCGHVYDVLDIDGPEAARAAAAFIEARFGSHACLIGGPSVVTSRGQHHFFEPGTYTNRVAVAGIKGLDWRTIGGLTALPPSVHKLGVVYRWEVTGTTTRDFSCPAEPIPRGVRALLEHKPEVPVAPRPSPEPLAGGGYNPAGLIAAVNKATEPGRNSVLHWAACRLGEDVSAGKVTATEAEEVARQLENAAVGTGLHLNEVEKTIRSGLASGKAA